MIGGALTPTRPSVVRRLVGDETGATLTEFGLVAPVLFVMIMGIFDMAHTQYTSAMINGAMQKAGRDLTLENAGSRQTDIDTRVKNEVLTVVPDSATVSFEKLSHFDFADIGEPEDFTDENGDNICNNNEVYVDANGNGQWDPNRGQVGIGGARDAVLYVATVTYPRLFPMYGLAGLSETVTLEASTVLRNQPFDEQDDRITDTGNCL